jgi:nitric oxide dioxygenase
MKNTTESSDRSFTTTLSDLIEYPASGILRKTLLKDNNIEYNLLCLVVGKELTEHTASRNAVITVVEGSGNLNLAGKDIALVPGVFIFMSARTPHAVQARSNLAFMLALSE